MYKGEEVRGELWTMNLSLFFTALLNFLELFNFILIYRLIANHNQVEKYIIFDLKHLHYSFSITNRDFIRKCKLWSF